MKEIIKDTIILARHITVDDINEGLTFFSKDEEYIQVGTWNYNKDKELPSHVHNEVPRTIKRTYEVLYIIEGKISADIYDIYGEYVESFEASKGDIVILLESAHGYKIIENGTKVLEVKNGPYLGAEIDRKRL